MYYIGIDLGGTNIAVGVVNEVGEMVYKDSIPTQRERVYQDIIKDMAMLSLKVIQDAGLSLSDIQSIGIGSPGTPDKKNGILVYSNNLKFRNVPMKEEMQKYIDRPIYIENDANCAALAESVAGASKDAAHSVAITIGTGIGGGVVIDKKVYSGFNGAGAELGHMVIVVDGEQCSCGRKGCWEAYASATACIRQTIEAAKQHPASLIHSLVNNDLSLVNAKTVFDAAKQGDEAAQRVVDQYIAYLAEGLLNVINAFMPEILVIGGGVCKEGEYLLTPLKKLIDEGIYSKDEIPQTKLVVAVMGNDAGIVGAAMLGKM